MPALNKQPLKPKHQIPQITENPPLDKEIPEIPNFI